MMNQTCSQTFIDQTELVEAIEAIVESCLQIEINARLTLDYKQVAPYRTFLIIPQLPDKNTIISNLARLLELTITPYISKARPGDVLFDVKKALNSNYFDQLVKTEIKKAFKLIEVRKDLAGRVLNHTAPIKEIKTDTPQLAQFLDTIRKGLDIHLGFKLFFQGNDFINHQLFLPVSIGSSIISQIYTNIEKVLVQNFTVFDEMGDTRIPITEGLIFKELLSVLIRISKKPKTHKKILKNIDKFEDIELFETVSDKNDQLLPKEVNAPLISKNIKLESELEAETSDPVGEKPPPVKRLKKKKLIKKKRKRLKAKSSEDQAYIKNINAGKSFKEDNTNSEISGDDLSLAKIPDPVGEKPLLVKSIKKKKLIRKKRKRLKTKSSEDQAYIKNINAGKSLREDNTNLEVLGDDLSQAKAPDPVGEKPLPGKSIKKKKLIREKRKRLKTKSTEDQAFIESINAEKSFKEDNTKPEVSADDLSPAKIPDPAEKKPLLGKRLKKKKLIRKKRKRLKTELTEDQANGENNNTEKKSKPLSQMIKDKKIKPTPPEENKSVYNAIITFERFVPEGKETTETTKHLRVKSPKKQIVQTKTIIRTKSGKYPDSQKLQKTGDELSKKVKKSKENHLFLNRDQKRISARSALYLNRSTKH